jgi:hypothetical protein
MPDLPLEDFVREYTGQELLPHQRTFLRLLEAAREGGKLAIPLFPAPRRRESRVESRVSNASPAFPPVPRPQPLAPLL